MDKVSNVATTLKIVDAALTGQDGRWSIAMEGGVITEVAPQIEAEAQLTLNAKGRLVMPGLVDGHLHLDKALLLAQHPAQTGTFQEALTETGNLKRGFTVEDIQCRAREVIEREISFGTTLMRSHVEVDPMLQLTAMEALVPLKQEYAWGLTLQLAVFAQEGITNQPGTVDLLQRAMTLGGDVIGSAPYVDPEPEQNIRIIFDLAQEFDCDVDFHLDFLDDDAPLLLPTVVAETLKRGWQGRVCLGHMTKLAGLPPPALQEMAVMLCDAGISILALPATDLYMMGRKDTHNVRRGVAPIHTLMNYGVTVGVATNNIQNLFTPFGDGDVLKICTLLAQTLQLGTAKSHIQCLEMATTAAAKAIGVQNYGVAPGNIADLVLINAKSASETISMVPIERTVIKGGKIVAETHAQSIRFSPELTQQLTHHKAPGAS
ncbi:n-acyl-d-amino-acid deacylase [Leptolyngbya sp. Heron Island J]|uniref:amidohydrolase family protein n=1 Tax=Leptolyngbya sp. Heron Island J TaxID=1385935 RepID=UPI0003B9D633|nr:amidohydrolase family protein [Leptolyngbya sp. Heron Island J]ESA38814.1 n-acyl-d-amino-acid deacylase [Leptolyngbya sp. Heron Island J]